MNTSTIKNYINKLLQQLCLCASECLAPALLIHLCIEGLSRESLIRPLFYPFQSPLVFLYNTLLICTTLSVSFFFKKRKFVRFFILALWLTVGITDFVLLQFRTTPFTAVDLLLLDSAFSIMGHYLTPVQIVLVVLAILLAVGIGIYLFMHTKKETTGTSRIYAGLVFGLFLLASICSTKLFVSCGILERNFGNLAQSFHTNGLPYCFFSSVFGTGISKPVSYSEDEIDRIMSSITNSPAPMPTPPSEDIPPTVTTPSAAESDPTATATPEPEYTTPADTEHPNFIFLQLESFFDPTYIKEAVFSSDPVPNFRNLKENYSSGFLTVPSIGAGTANTEFELLTGINLDFFGPGEYPYKTVLKDTPCESIAYNLSSLGLTAHALHNNDGTFYERHEVFSQLGFDTFTPIEYMGTYYTTPLGWAKDDILLPNILNALNSTEGQDFIYTISVQGHGSYPDKETIADPEITVEALPAELKDNYYEILYFVNQLHEMDHFLYCLTEALKEYEEEVVLVLYGDHLPTFPFTDDLLENNNIFQTEYVIWTNRPSGDPVKKDLEAYALSAHVLDCYDIHEGLFTRFHQTQADSDTYLEDMKMLAYDVLYGSYESYDGVLPFEPTQLQFGIVPISIRTVLFQSREDYCCLFINGENFTPYSIAYINDEPCTTTYINPQRISVTGFEPSEELTVRVAQVGKDSYPLSFTKPFTLTVSSEDYPQD